jgi:L-cysteine desulfidase
LENTVSFIDTTGRFQMDKHLLVSVLKKEIQKTVGCTDPVAVSLAVAAAVKRLGEVPQKIDVTVSPNIYKNGISVGVPGTGKRGLVQAAKVGALLPDWSDKELDILNHIDDSIVNEAQKFSDNDVRITCRENSPDNLYIKATVSKNGNTAWSIIQGDYANIIETGKNDKAHHASVFGKASESVEELLQYKIHEIIDTILDTEIDDLRFLINSALINKNTALEGLESKETKFGSAFKQLNEPQQCHFPYSAIHLSKIYTAAAAEARMIGLKVPIMAIAGSGNHGITNFLGVLAVSEVLGTSDIQLARALAISSSIAVYIKGYMGRMTALCGCAVAPAVGVAAATVYLLGGDYTTMVHAMNSVVGALAGIVCDGAKESCAYKLSTAAAAAIEYGYLATEKGVYIPDKMGIIAEKVEDTFKNLGELNNPGMVQTDKCLVDIIKKIQGNK